MQNDEELRKFTGKARLRARDIRQTAQGRNIDPFVLTTLETLAEQDGTLRKQIEMLADLTNKCIDAVSNLTSALSVIKDNFPILQKADAVKEMGQVALDRIKITDGEEG